MNATPTLRARRAIPPPPSTPAADPAQLETLPERDEKPNPVPVTPRPGMFFYNDASTISLILAVIDNEHVLAYSESEICKRNITQVNFTRDVDPEFIPLNGSLFDRMASAIHELFPRFPELARYAAGVGGGA